MLLRASHRDAETQIQIQRNDLHPASHRDAETQIQIQRNDLHPASHSDIGLSSGLTLVKRKDSPFCEGKSKFWRSYHISTAKVQEVFQTL